MLGNSYTIYSKVKINSEKSSQVSELISMKDKLIQTYTISLAINFNLTLSSKASPLSIPLHFSMSSI